MSGVCSKQDLEDEMIQTDKSPEWKQIRRLIILEDKHGTKTILSNLFPDI